MGFPDPGWAAAASGPSMVVELATWLHLAVLGGKALALATIRSCLPRRGVAARLSVFQSSLNSALQPSPASLQLVPEGP